MSPVKPAPLIVFFLLLVSGCATYYQRTISFQEQFVTGQFENASAALDKAKSARNGRNQLLYLLQKGTVLHHMAKYEESNVYFEDAYLFAEDLQKNYAIGAVSLLTNPEVSPYRGEDFELVLLHYYKAINYLNQDELDNALIECRRLNIKLEQLNDRYDNRKNRYAVDAFALNLAGMIYEASGEINNAFISYRNAYEAYEAYYKKFFNVSAPRQLKKDLLRTAYLIGFDDELAYYEKKFDMSYSPEKPGLGEIIIFWHTGLGPVKNEWSINFLVVKGKGGAGFFVNEELGISIPFAVTGGNGSSTAFGDLKFVRVAFPQYVERKPYYRTAEIIFENQKFPLETVQNINSIAYSTLEDRMLRELSTALLRLALKQASEYAANKVNPNLGALLSIANAVSEKADTRNWQSIPYEIQYVRLKLPPGEHQIDLRAYSPLKSKQKSEVLQVQVYMDEIAFYHVYNLESVPLEL